MAITTSKARKQRNTKTAKFAKYLMTSSHTIPAGAMVMIPESAAAFAYSGDAYFAENAADTAFASGSFVGVATKSVTSTTAGETYVEVMYGHEELFTTNTTLVGLVGTAATVYDNDVVTSAASTDDTQVGEIIEVPSSTTAWVAVRKLVKDLT